MGCGTCCSDNRPVPYEYRKWSSKTTSISTIAKEFGVGMALYFRFVRFTMGMLLILTITCLPTIIETITYSIASKTGNMNLFQITFLDATSMFRIVIDIIVAIFFCLSIGQLHLHQKVARMNYGRGQIRMSQYAVLVRDLPPDTTRSQIQSHFSAYGAIREISMREIHSSLLRMHTQRAQLLESYDALMETLSEDDKPIEHPPIHFPRRPPSDDKMAEYPGTKNPFKFVIQILGGLRDLNWHMKQLMSLERKYHEQEKHTSAEPMCCVVVFTFAKDALAAIEAHKLTLARFFCGLCVKRDKFTDQFGDRVAISVKESIEAHKLTLARFFCGLCVKRDKFTDQFGDRVAISVKECPEHTDIIWENLSTPSWTFFWHQIVSTLIAICVVIISIVFFVFMRSTITSWGNSTSSWVTNQIIYWSSYLIIWVTDFALHFVVRLLAMWECHPTHSAREGAVLTKYYVYQLACKIVSIAYVRLFQVMNGFDSISDIEFSTTYSLWISTTSADLLFFMFFEIVVYNILDMVLPWVIMVIRRIFSRTNYSAMLAEQGLEFRVSFIYTNSLVVITLCVAFSMIQPLLIPLALIYFWIHYWLSKVRILKLLKRPPHFNHQLSRIVEVILLLAAAMHGLFGFVFFSSDPDGQLPVWVVFMRLLLQAVLILIFAIPWSGLCNCCTDNEAFILLGSMRDQVSTVSADVAFGPFEKRHYLLPNEIEGLDSFKPLF
ncbi:putative multi-domain containing protein [Aduncisulcus paluster]|uniref:Multi-domain containing protein n=1 Tax=Aduncisulcus paluster TaxID=2918883 RepID=A0ABQ5JXK0_9EUKA|nr:putative multi-domain containing protein [Aduncisulcus paluster]